LKILLFADGNNIIGMGHIIRTLNLGKELKRRKHDIVFITKDRIAKTIFSKLDKCRLFNNLDSKNFKVFLKKHQPDIIIIDKIQEEEKVLKILHSDCPVLVSIDYIGPHKKFFNCAFNMLYPYSGKSKKAYSGTEFAIIDKRFQKKHVRISNKKIQNILVLQGDSDTYCFTPKIIESLDGFSDHISITTVVGSTFRCWSDLRRICKKSKKTVKILQNVKDMSKIMMGHDIAITAGGITLLELAGLGIPSIIICGEKFETETATYFSKNGFGLNLGFGKNITKKKIREATNELINNYQLRMSMNIRKNMFPFRG